MPKHVTVEDIRKILLKGDGVEDDTITLLGEKAESTIALECGEDEMPEKFKFIAVELTVAFINRRGKEGMSADTEGEVSSSLVVDLLDQYRKYFDEYRRNKENSQKGKVYLV